MKVELIDKMGTDLSVVNAARVSFNKESHFDEQGNLLNSDIKLIHYLANHNHWSPFAHCFLSFRIKAPIFVARQLVKHQVGLAWNEVSRRYVSDKPEFWFPTEWRGKPVNAKQGSNGVVQEVSIDFQGTEINGETLTYLCNLWYEVNIANGMAPEMARNKLPLETMTEWIWSGSLMAFARVCKLRLDPHAQFECQLVAQQLDVFLREAFPISYAALMENNN